MADAGIDTDCPADEFPDYRRLLRDAIPAAPRHRIAVDAAGLRAALGESAGLPPVVALGVDRGAVRVLPSSRHRRRGDRWG